MRTVTKRDIVLHVTDKLEKFTQAQVYAVVQEALDHITDCLARGDEVVMRNFGSFEVRRTKAKVGRNPMVKGSSYAIPPRAVVRFRAGKNLRDRAAQVLPMLEDKAKKDKAG